MLCRSLQLDANKMATLRKADHQKPLHTQWLSIADGEPSDAARLIMAIDLTKLAIKQGMITMFTMAKVSVTQGLDAVLTQH